MSTRLLLPALMTLCCLASACSGSSSPAPAGGGADVAALQCLPQPSAPPAPTLRPAQTTAFELTVQNILPPGQSGHFPQAGPDCPLCALPGQAPATYGPHIDDQRLMYWRSEFKDGRFFDASQASPALTLRDGAVRIYRDAYGVPVVHGDTAADVWYGAGYALAQDRLFLIDQAIRQARGTSAEVLGSGSVPADVQTRVLGYTDAEYAQMEAGLSDAARTALEAHRDGINAWIARVNDPTMLDRPRPQEFVLLNYRPQPVTTTDILALGVLMTRFVAANGGDEMANVLALQALEARHGRALGQQIFGDVLWLDDQRATVTIPDREFSNIPTPPGLRAAVFAQAADYAATLPAELASGPGTGAFPEPSVLIAGAEDIRWPAPRAQLAAWVERLQQRPQRISASYQVVVGPERTPDGSTLLISGPQLGYSYPTLLAELEVRGGGYQARGTTVAGLPVVGIGYGERIAWALTTGESKTIDSFIETIVSDDGTQYRHQNQTKTMDCRTETVRFRASVQGAPNVAEPVPGLNATGVEVCRTVHGPVVARAADGKLARTVSYAMWMREVQTIEGVLAWNRARNFAEFDAAMAQVTWNENTMYADADGNIAYYHPGLHPWRHPGADQRLPLKGDGSQDHCGELSVANRPHRINPLRGFMHNWNNKPATGWGDGVGGDASQEPAAQDGRNRNWETLLAGAQTVSYEQLLAFDRRIGRIDPRAAALLDPILACDNSCGFTVKQQRLVDLLKTWDRQHYNDAIDIEAAAGEPGSLDTAGATIFGEIAQAMVDEITAEILPADFIARHAVRGNHPYDAGTFHKLAARLLDPAKSSIPLQFDWLRGRNRSAFIKDAVAQALGRLEQQFGADTDPSQYHRVHARASVCALADPLVGPCLDMPHQDRGSWIHAVRFGS